MKHLNGDAEVEGARPEGKLRCFSLDGQNVRSPPGTPQFSQQVSGNVEPYYHRRRELVCQSERKDANPAAEVKD